MKKDWQIKTQDEELKNRLSKSLGISTVTSGILINRGLTKEAEVRRFLESDLSASHDPSKLKGIKKALSRLKQAFKNNEKILIYGDYDADGITATALLFTVFSKFTSNLTYYIPNRLEEGYGLNKQACDLAKEKGASLIVTVDCGISAKEEVDYLNSLGIDVIITDHHEAQDDLPRALSIIDPHQPGCSYPFKELAGVGVAFKLCQAIVREYITDSFSYLRPHLDLVAIGTIADVVPLLDENRIFVKEGLKQINETNKIGLKALIKISRLADKTILSRHIAFILGPRINAAGRLGNADAPLRLLLTKNEDEANALAKLLNDGNRDRRKIQQKAFQRALSLVERDINFKDQKVIVLDDDWHPGIMGIVASKLVERFYRPTILISTRDEIAKGSGRSIDNFHLFKAIKKCSSLLKSFGGHKKACGITLAKDKIDYFKKRLNKIAFEVLLPEDFFPQLEIDSELSFDKIDLNLLKELDSLMPYGAGNRKPVFATKNLLLKTPPRPLRKNGIKLLLTDGSSTHEALGFSINGVNFNSLGKRKISLAYTPVLDSFQGRNYINLQIKDIKEEDKE